MSVEGQGLRQAVALLALINAEVYGDADPEFTNREVGRILCDSDIPLLRHTAMALCGVALGELTECAEAMGVPRQARIDRIALAVERTPE